jgi:acetoin utilization deacetylase AcuC-like enzyme
MLLFADELMQRHDPGPMHPECPERLQAVLDAFEHATDVEWRTPSAASREQVLRVHRAEHVDLIDSLRGRSGHLDADTVLSSDSVAAAYLASGAAVDAVTAVVGGQDKHAFALVRPPGHHAEAQTAMGFCLFNNVAVAAEHARAELGVERVLIIDWDVHHGNGTQHSFFDRDDVLFVSVHQYPFYPGTGDIDETGKGAGEGFTINVPFAAGRGNGDYLAAFRDIIAPAADAFQPDLVLISAGFDAHRADPLGGMETTEDGYAAMTAVVKDIADRHADGRIVLTLEGGYDLRALGRSARACVDVLTGATAPAIDAASERGGALLSRVKERHRKRWKL